MLLLKQVAFEKSLEVSFADAAVRNFFKEWVSINDSIEHKSESKAQSLNFPSDMDIFEMLDTAYEKGKENVLLQTNKVSWKNTANKYLNLVGLNFRFEQKRLYDVLQISKLKIELSEIRKTGDIQKISEKELEIVKQVRQEIDQFTYRLNYEKPRDIIKENKYLNCLGATILASVFLEKLEIKHLLALPPDHAMTFVITSDYKIYWVDFTPGNNDLNYMEIVDSDLIGENFDGEQISTKDIFDLEQKQNQIVIKLRWARDHIILQSPLKGIKLGLMNNLGGLFAKLGQHENAIATFKSIIKINPQSFDSYFNMGNSFRELGLVENAMNCYRKVIELNPNDDRAYNWIGNLFSDQNNHGEAISNYHMAIKTNPSQAYAYNNIVITLNLLTNMMRQQSKKMDPQIVKKK